MRLFRRPYPLSWHLVVLVLASMIPFFLFSAFMVDQLVHLERQASERRLKREAQKLKVSMDQEFVSVIRTLQALAVSTDLKERDLKSFHKELQQVQKSQPGWKTILVHDASSRMVVDAIREFGEVTSNLEPSSLRTVLETGQPDIGRVTQAGSAKPFTYQYAFAVRVPVFHEGRLTYVLSAIVSVSRLQAIANDSMPSEWTRTIVDEEGTIGARSRHPEKFVGQSATPSFIQAYHSADEGLVPEKALEGEPVYLAFDRSRFSGWTVCIAVSKDLLEAPAQRSRTLVVGIGSAILLVFGGLALLYSRQIAFRIRSAAMGAMTLAEGKVPQIKPTLVKEVEQLRTSLLTVANLLQERERERNENLNQAIEARADAERANRAKSEFLANMSHELRTPLGVVVGFAELMVDPEMTPEERVENLQIIQRNGQHLLRLIDDILDLSKVEARRLSLEFEDIPLKEFMTGIMSEAKPRALEKNLDFTLTSTGPLPDMIRTDPVRLRQIIHNLVGNAIKFTDKGTVNLHLESRDDHLVIAVRDSGIGISPDQQKLLFRPFTQADGSHTRKYGGTGLGLALAQRLAEFLGGDIQLLESLPGQGSVFQARVKFR